MSNPRLGKLKPLRFAVHAPMTYYILQPWLHVKYNAGIILFHVTTSEIISAERILKYRTRTLLENIHELQ